MTTIQINVSDEIVAKYGQQALIERLERVLAWEDVQQKAVRLATFLAEHNLDHDLIIKEARSRAWASYKTTALKGVLTDE